jgi:cytochrome c oxidase subunit 2
MNRFENYAIRFSIVLMMIFVFALIYAVDKRNSNLPECVPYSAAYTKPRLVQIDDKTFQAFYVAKMWSFEPARIEVPAGSDVDFYVTSNDVVHGFNIYDKNVNMMAVHGGIGKTTVHFKEPGTYKVTCHEYCGIAHQSMQAEVVVTTGKK